jgi:hypothetical protein
MANGGQSAPSLITSVGKSKIVVALLCEFAIVQKIRWRSLGQIFCLRTLTGFRIVPGVTIKGGRRQL